MNCNLSGVVRVGLLSYGCGIRSLVPVDTRSLKHFWKSWSQCSNNNYAVETRVSYMGVTLLVGVGGQEGVHNG